MRNETEMKVKRWKSRDESTILEVKLENESDDLNTIYDIFGEPKISNLFML